MTQLDVRTRDVTTHVFCQSLASVGNDPGFTEVTIAAPGGRKRRSLKSQREEPRLDQSVRLRSSLTAARTLATREAIA